MRVNNTIFVYKMVERKFCLNFSISIMKTIILWILIIAPTMNTIFKFGLPCEKKRVESQHTIWLHLCVYIFSFFYPLTYIKFMDCFDAMPCHAMRCDVMWCDMCACVYSFLVYNRRTLKKSRNVCVWSLRLFVLYSLEYESF